MTTDELRNLSRRLRTRAPYRSDVQIMVEMFGPEPPVIVLGQGDYPTAVNVADRVTAEMNTAADAIETLAAEVIALREREARLVEALAAAMYACRVVDEAVKEGHQSLPALVNHFLQAVEPARAALAEIEKEAGE